MSILQGKEYLGRGREAYISLTSCASIGGRLFLMTKTEMLSKTLFHDEIIDYLYGTDLLDAIRKFTMRADDEKLNEFYLLDSNIAYHVIINRIDDPREKKAVK